MTAANEPAASGIKCYRVLRQSEGVGQCENNQIGQPHERVQLQVVSQSVSLPVSQWEGWVCRSEEVQPAPEGKEEKRRRRGREELVKEGCWHLFQRLNFIEQHRDFIS